MNVLFASAEIFPLLKTGGLADVSAALSAALLRAGASVRLLLPGFAAIAAGFEPAGPRIPLPPFAPGSAGPWTHAPHIGPRAHTAGPAGVWLQPARWRSPPARESLPASTPKNTAIDAYLVCAEGLFDQEGNPYTDPHGQPWPDSAARFAWLSWAAAALGLGLDPHWQPDVLHGHDWHTGLAPTYLRALAAAAGPHARVPRTVFTIHNLAYQGLFGPQWLQPLGLPEALFGLHGLEFYGQISFLKAALVASDVLATVSPRYAQEITTPEQGCGLDGVLRERQNVLHGILNGVDTAVWNPATDPHLSARYQAGRWAGKARCKRAVQAELGLAASPRALLFVVVSRLTEQKGLHLLPEVADALVAAGGQLAVLGAGDAAIQNALAACAQRHSGAIALRLGYDEPLAHRLIAGGDVIVVPSRYEPCGLTQLYGLRYGTLPLVRAVGGLADTVADCSLENLADGSASGFVFHALKPAELWRAMRRAFALAQRPAEWRRVQQAAMARPLGWDSAAQAYLALYRGHPLPEPLPSQTPTEQPAPTATP